MEVKLERLHRLTYLLTAFTVLWGQPAFPQAFVTLYSFSNQLDGRHPSGVPHGIITSGPTLYGTTGGGGKYGGGTIFSLQSDGTGFTVLHSFGGIDPVYLTNSDGAGPSGLVLSGDTLYGTTTFGGAAANGTVFAVSTNGSTFTSLHTFSATDSGGMNSDGGQPYAGLAVSGGVLYGTASLGGNGGSGTLFALGTNGKGFTALHNFTALSTSAPNGINGDGATPFSELTLSGNKLFGSATYGGPQGNGTLYEIDTNGANFTVLYSFSALDMNRPSNYDGAYPNGLIFSAGTLYGTANYGGISNGTVFAFPTNDVKLTTLHSFTGLTPSGDNADGAAPIVSLILGGNVLYGITPEGGASGSGTIFAVSVKGTGFTNLHSFTATNKNGINWDGAAPQGGLALSGNTLYGTAYEGGSSGYGTVFSMTLPTVASPSLVIAMSGTNVILTWPTNSEGLRLQSTSSLVTSWTNLNPASITVNGQNTVTNPAVGAAGFFRLSQ